MDEWIEVIGKSAAAAADSCFTSVRTATADRPTAVAPVRQKLVGKACGERDDAISRARKVDWTTLIVSGPTGAA